MAINIHIPKGVILKPVITVFGVGGAGGNAINNMILSKLCGINFVAANTDAQALSASLAEKKIQLGEKLTKGLGAGANPRVGASAAEETINEIRQHVDGANMVFITAGMGGGTGTGAAPIIARTAKENGVLTVGVVTKPFDFEGVHRNRLAAQGIEELEKYVDTLVVIPNQNLISISNAKTTFAEAFKMADNVLYSGIRGITDLMLEPGLINLDFADIQAVMNEMGKAMLGSGEASGENRAIKAAEAAIANPLLEHSSMKGAKGVLINITGGLDMTLFEVDEAANRIRSEIENDNANIIFGSTFNDELNGKIRVSVVATGINTPHVSKRSILQTPAAISEEKFDVVVDEGAVHANSGALDDMSSYMDDDHKKGIFGKFVGKIFGKPKRSAPKLKSEPVEMHEEFLQKEIYDKPALVRKEEKASEIS